MNDLHEYDQLHPETWVKFCKFTSRYLWFDDATDTWHCHADPRRCLMDDCRWHAYDDDVNAAVEQVWKLAHP